MILDWNLRVKSANQTFYEKFEVNEEETVGSLVFELGNGQWDIPRLRELLEVILPENDSFDDFEVSHDFENIGHRDMILNGRKIDHKQWILLAIEDITERKRSLLALQNSEERLRKVLETEAVGVIFLDRATGTLVDANNAFLKLTGYNRNQIQNGELSWRDLTPPEWLEITKREIEEPDATGHIGPYEKECLCVDGSRIWLMFTGRDLNDGTIVEYCIDISRRKQAEEQREVLLAELNHRVKNTLTVVQSLATQTIARSRSLDEFAEAFRGRISALARGHSQLLKGDWRPVDLQYLVRESVSTFEPSRVMVDGPNINVSAKVAMSLNMMLHELETNSAKYGALSQKGGYVGISWKRENKLLYLTWQESGGPRVVPPEHEGFGTRLIRQLAQYELGGHAEFHFAPDGLRAEFLFPSAGQ